jgi:hypothetical protein
MSDNSEKKKMEWQSLVLQVMTSNRFTNADVLFRTLDNRKCITCLETALVIEEMKGSDRYPLSFCRSAKYNGLLDESRRKFIRKIHIIMPCVVQMYHVSGLERCCHYTIRIDDISQFQTICGIFELDTEVYCGTIQMHETNFITIRNNVSALSKVLQDIYNVLPKETSFLKKRSSNLTVSYGFSGRNRDSGGPPVLTKGIGYINVEKLLPLLLHILCELTEDRKRCFAYTEPVDESRLTGFSRRMGENFGYILKRDNVFEGVDCSMRVIGRHTESLLSTHCDVMNDWRPGNNFCSVIKAVVVDDIKKCKVNLSVIAYSRKVVGDYLYGPNNYPITDHEAKTKSYN